MKLSELYERLSLGELSNLAMGESGSIREEDKKKIVLHLNDGLLQLHTRFVLSTKVLLLEEREHITMYHFLRKYAESANCGEPNYIKDLPSEPFEEDLIRVLQVFDAHGNERVLNDTDDPHSLFTPSPQTLQIPNPKERRPLQVVYQAKHKRIDDIYHETEFTIPFVLEKALQSYIAYLIYSNMNGQDNKTNGQIHFAEYDRICAEIADREIVPVALSSSNHKLHRRGFP